MHTPKHTLRPNSHSIKRIPSVGWKINEVEIDIFNVDAVDANGWMCLMFTHVHMKESIAYSVLVGRSLKASVIYDAERMQLEGSFNVWKEARAIGQCGTPSI